VKTGEEETGEEETGEEETGEEETGEEETMGVESIESVAPEVAVGVAILKGEQLLWTCGKLSPVLAKDLKRACSIS
jgi:hypothetical protein